MEGSWAGPSARGGLAAADARGRALRSYCSGINGLAAHVVHYSGARKSVAIACSGV